MEYSRFNLKQSAKQIIQLNFKVCTMTALVLVLITLAMSLLESWLLPAYELSEETMLAIVRSDDPASYVLPLMRSMFTVRRVAGSLIFSVVMMMLVSPGTFGAYGIYFRLASGGSASVGELKGWYATGGLVVKSVFFQIVVNVFTALWALLLVSLPMVVIMALMAVAMVTELYAAAVLLSVLLLAAAIAGTILLSVITGIYTAAMFFFGENPALGIMGSIRAAKKLLKGRRWQFFWLRLSFILWDLLTGITFGIAGVYVIPYKGLTFSVYFNTLRGVSFVPPAVEHKTDSDDHGGEE